MQLGGVEDSLLLLLQAIYSKVIRSGHKTALLQETGKATVLAGGGVRVGLIQGRADPHPSRDSTVPTILPMWLHVFQLFPHLENGANRRSPTNPNKWVC